jgi:hypothetical protein
MSVIQSPVGIQVAPFATLAPTRNPAMQPAMITCNNQRADGAPCGEPALVRLVHYHYGSVGGPNSLGDAKELREARYEIECPRCGKRTQVVKYE